MIYYGLKPLKSIHAVRGQYGLQPIAAVYYGSRKIWEPEQAPLDKVIINISAYGLADGITDVDVGYYEYEFDPAARQSILAGAGSVTLQTLPGTYFAIDALPFNYPSTPPQVNIYVEKEGDSGVLYENTTFIELDTSAPAIYNIVVSLSS